MNTNISRFSVSRIMIFKAISHLARNISEHVNFVRLIGFLHFKNAAYHHSSCSNQDFRIISFFNLITHWVLVRLQILVDF